MQHICSVVVLTLYCCIVLQSKRNCNTIQHNNQRALYCQLYYHTTRASPDPASSFVFREFVSCITSCRMQHRNPSETFQRYCCIIQQPYTTIQQHMLPLYKLHNKNTCRIVQIAQLTNIYLCKLHKPETQILCNLPIDKSIFVML